MTSTCFPMYVVSPLPTQSLIFLICILFLLCNQLKRFHMDKEYRRIAPLSLLCMFIQHVLPANPTNLYVVTLACYACLHSVELVYTMTMVEITKKFT